MVSARFDGVGTVTVTVTVGNGITSVGAAPPPHGRRRASADLRAPEGLSAVPRAAVSQGEAVVWRDA